jgi:penicillin-binding protein 2
MLEDLIIESTATPTLEVNRRYRILFFMLAAVLIILAGRGFFLQVVQGGSFRTNAEGNRVTTIPVPAPRGIIYDINHNQLVENVASTDLVLDPANLPPEEYESSLYEKLPSIIDVSPDQIREAVTTARNKQRLVPLVSSLEHAEVIAIEQMLPELPGVQLVSSLVRNYPYGHVLAHVLGYTAPVNSRELETRQELKMTDIVGKSGLEKQYDEALRGEHGYSLVEIDASGKPRKQLSQEPAENGHDIELTLDAEMQKMIFDLFAEKDSYYQAEKGKGLSGAVVALDPRSGAIRGLVSYPSFDPNFFSRPGWSGKADDMFKDESRPLFNRAVDGAYPPGSTIKPLLAAAALEEQVISSNTTFLSTGGIAVGPWFFPDWKDGGHGITDVYKALSESVNTFFYTAVGGFEGKPGLGIERAVKYLKQFGWGEKTGIDLPTEASGLLPSAEWKQAVKGEPWYIGDTYHVAIGQGDILATPLQIAVATGGIANNGSWHQPFLTRRIISEIDELNNTTDSKSMGISSGHLQTIRQGMRQTVTSGSAVRLKDLPIAVAGKTGTAQVGGTKDTHAWFTSFAPYEEPELILVVLLEFSGDGDKEAVPFAQEIWQWWEENRSH